MTRNDQPLKLIATGPATAILPGGPGHGPPITVIGTQRIREGFDARCLQQAINSRQSPGVTRVVLNPDGHAGYGAPVGCVMVSPTHIYPGPVGVDVKCSMSLLQLNLPADQLADRGLRRRIIKAITQRVPTGAGTGQRHAPRARRIDPDIARVAVVEGVSAAVCQAMGLPGHWADRCEDCAHVGHDGTHDSLAERLDRLESAGIFRNLEEKLAQLGSYGGGNHFGECEVVQLSRHDRMRHAADVFGLRDGCVAFLSHCGSRGFGNILAQNQFRLLESMFDRWSIPFPGGDKHLVYAPLGTSEADAYLDDMALGANFATVNHMLINALVLEAFQEVIPGVEGDLVYFISHNIARKEIVDGAPAWVHRKGATRAFPAGHFALKGTMFHETGHPILLPGNPRDGSVVMVAEPGAEKSCYSVNHGAGRQMGRREAMRRLDQREIDDDLEQCDILSNCRLYPRDEAPAAYKDFNEVLASVEQAGLASTVARLKARFVIKDSSGADD
jgi:tRNA-splicing ligase RtcB (3'-phosphate/5'-hydroxy nucleic acid ligase)